MERGLSLENNETTTFQQTNWLLKLWDRGGKTAHQPSASRVRIRSNARSMRQSGKQHATLKVQCLSIIPWFCRFCSFWEGGCFSRVCSQTMGVWKTVLPNCHGLCYWLFTNHGSLENSTTKLLPVREQGGSFIIIPWFCKVSPSF